MVARLAEYPPEGPLLAADADFRAMSIFMILPVGLQMNSYW